MGRGIIVVGDVDEAVAAVAAGATKMFRSSGAVEDHPDVMTCMVAGHWFHG
jgi:hypothetical protein